MRGHQLDNEIINLILRDFAIIQEFFTQFKSLFIHLKFYGIDKKGEYLIPSILLKMSFEYSLFVSTFHATELELGVAWKKIKLGAFYTSLTQEIDKLMCNMHKI